MAAAFFPLSSRGTVLTRSCVPLRRLLSATAHDRRLEAPDLKVSFVHCVDLVKGADRPAYLTGLLLPEDVKLSYFALRGLNIETGKIKDLRSRSEHNPQKAKMQWWSEAVALCFDKRDGLLSSDGSIDLDAKYSQFRHPVVVCLSAAIEGGPTLTRRLFEIMMFERTQNLDVQQYSKMQDCVSHGQHIHGTLLKLHCESLNVMDDEVDVVCDHLGVGIHIAKSLKFISELKAANEMVIPSEVAREAGMTADMIPPPRKEGEGEVEGSVAPQLQSAIFKLACEGKEHTDQARERFMNLDSTMQNKVACVLREGVEATRVYESLEETDFARVKGEAFATSLPILMAKNRLLMRPPF